MIPIKGRLAFDELLLRIHPAESRVRKLAAEHPASFIVFDLLADERGNSLTKVSLEERRQRLEKFAARYFRRVGRIHLSPATTEFHTTKKWFTSAGVNLDGLEHLPESSSAIGVD